jgi:hypothetical protein
VKRRKIYLDEVRSRAVSAAGYDEARRELYILYRSERRGLYLYSDVTPSEWHMLQKTSSVGAIVNAHIKPRHSYRPLDPHEVEIVIRQEIPSRHD